MNPQFPLGSLVELLDQYTDVYTHSPTGARGWIRARREMPKTDPEAYIEWDKGHWRYHGEPDGWTYEHHFRAVDPSEPDIGLDDPSITKMIADARAQVESERCPSCGEFHAEEDVYIDGLMQAQDAALAGEAFLMITLRPIDMGSTTIYEPELWTESLNEVSRQMIHAQVLHLAAQLYERDLMNRVDNMERGYDH